MAVIAADLVALVRTEGVAQTQAELDAVGASAEKVGAKSAAGTAGLLGFGAAGLFISDSMFNASEQFDTWMRDLASLDPTIANSTSNYDAMAASIKQVALDNAQMATDVVKGMYYVASAGYTGKDALEIVTAAARDANAGLTDAMSSTKLVTAVLNAYGLSADQASNISDKLFAIVRGGVLRYSDLTAQMGDNLSVASALGVSIDDLGVGYDVLSRHGVSAAEISTQLNALMSAMLKPSTELTNVIHSLGYENGQAMISQLGLIGTLQALYNSTGGNNTELAAMFKNIRGLRGEMGLMTGDTKDVASAQANMANSAGAVDEALAQQTQATSYHLREMKVAINEVMIAMGNGLRPIISTIADGITLLSRVVLAIPSPLLALAGAVMGVVSAFAFLQGGGALLEEMMGGPLGAALEGIIASAVAAAAPFLALAGAVYVLYQAFQLNFLGIKDEVTNAFNQIASAWDSFTSVFAGTMANDPRNWGWGELASTVDAFGNAIKFVFGDNSFSDWLNKTAITVQQAVDIFHRLTDHGINPLAAALEAIGYVLTKSGLQGLGSFFVKLGESLGHAVQAFDNFKRMGIDPFIAGLMAVSDFFRQEGMQGVADWFDRLANVLSDHDWGGLLRVLTDGIVALLLQLAKIAEITIPKVLVSIAEWAWGTIVQPLGEWIIGHLPGLSDIRQGASVVLVPLGEVAVSIGGWLVSLAAGVPGLWDKLTTWVLQQTGAVSGGRDNNFQAVPIPSVSVAIESWAAGKIPDLGTWLWGQVKGTSVRLTSIIVNVANWAAGNIADMSDFLWSFTKGASVKLTSILVSVANWAAGAIFDLGTWLYGYLKDTKVYLVTVAVAISSWSIDLSQSNIGQAIADSFKTVKDLGLTIGKAIFDSVKGVDWTKVVTSDAFNFGATVGGAIHDAIVTSVIAVKNADWATIFTWVANGLENAIPLAAEVFLGVATAVVSNFLGFWSSVLGGKDAAKSFSSFISDVATGIQNNLKPDAFSTVAQAIWDAIWNGLKALASKANPLDLVPGTGGGGTGQVGAGHAASVGIEGGPGLGLPPGGGAKGPLEQLVKFATPDFSDVKTALDGLSKSAQTTATDFNRNIATGFNNAVKAVQTAVSNIIQSVNNGLSGLGAVATKDAGQFASEMTSGFNNALRSVQTVISNIIQSVNNGLSGLGEMASKASGQFNSGIADGFNKAVASAQIALGNIVSSVFNALSGLYGPAHTAGTQLGQGLADGISAMTSTVVDAAIRLSNAAQSATTTVNAIHSPSEVYRQFGQYIGAGFALGMDDSRPLVARSAAGMLGAPNFASASSAGGGVHIHGNVSITVSGAGKNGHQIVQDIYAELGQARNMQVGYNG